MKTKIIALAVALFATGSFSAMAQDCAGRRCPSESRTAAPGDRADKMYRPQKFTDYAFEGILLTVDQQAKVDALNAEMQAQRKQNCDSVRDCREKKCKDEGKKCERRCKDRSKECRGMAPDSCRREYIGKVKEILTPEQYTTFLENIVFMPRQPRHGAMRTERLNPRHERAVRTPAAVEAQTRRVAPN